MKLEMKDIELERVLELISDEVFRTESKYEGDGFGFVPMPSFEQRKTVVDRLKVGATVNSSGTKLILDSCPAANANFKEIETIPAFSYLVVDYDFETYDRDGKSYTDFIWYVWGYNTLEELKSHPSFVSATVYVRDYMTYRRVEPRFYIWLGETPTRVDSLAFEVDEAGVKRDCKRLLTLPMVCEFHWDNEVETILANSPEEVYNRLAFGKLPDMMQVDEDKTEEGTILFEGSTYTYKLRCDGRGGWIDSFRNSRGWEYDPEQFDFIKDCKD